jgi:hypothetical protein
MRVGLDAKRFPKLAGKRVIWITVTFHKDTYGTGRHPHRPGQYKPCRRVDK